MYVSKRAQALLPHMHDNLVYTLCLAAFLVFVLVLTSQNLGTVMMSSSVDEASKSLHDDVQVEPPRVLLSIPLRTVEVIIGDKLQQISLFRCVAGTGSEDFYAYKYVAYKNL